MTELWLRELQALCREGGWVFGPLVVLAFGIYFTLLSIFSLLRFPEAPPPGRTGWHALLRRQEIEETDRSLVRQWFGQDSAAGELEQRLFGKLRRRIPFALTLISAAPLLGLLGTVSGMFACFHGLTVPAGRSATDTISLGISEALITTEAGLVIALPAFIVCSILKSRAERLESGFKRLTAAVQIAEGRNAGK